jgi:predicted amidohydrolase YtcJ
LLGIHVAVNRVALGAGTEPLLQGQRLTVVEAIDAYTRGSAFVSRREHRSGTVEIGSAADFAVIDADILAIDSEAIGEVRVTRTYAQGRIVHAM